MKRKDEADDVGRLSDEDDDDEGVVETDVQVQLLRVGVSRPEWDAGALRWIERAAGDDVLFPVDLTFRMISQANAATGARRRGVDARVTVVSGPTRLALSPSKIATLTRVSQRLAAAVASSPARPCGVFAPVWSSYSYSSSDNGVFRDGVSGAASGAASWAVWRPTPPAGYASLGDCVSFGGDKPPTEPVLVIRDSPAFTAAPVRFERVALPDAAIANGVADGLALWRPVPPPGFVSLGLVATSIRAGDHQTADANGVKDEDQTRHNPRRDHPHGLPNPPPRIASGA